MAQIQKRGIATNAVDGEKLRLNNNQTLRARNLANTADVDILKVNTANEVELMNLPKYDGSNVATEEFVTNITDTLIPLTQKGAANGVATLDAGGKIPASQLPNSVVELQGEWNAATNTPTLANGVGNAGDVYLVTVAGTQNLGSGPIEFKVGDWAVYAASGVWFKSVNSNEVTSVNTKIGAVVLNTDDIGEGTTNLYHTPSRARTAAVVDSMAGTETDQAPSVSSVKTFIESQSADIAVETFTLTAGDITNGYVELATEAEDIIHVTPKGFPVQHPVDDYTTSVVLGKTRVTFAGDMLLLEAGDKLSIAYSL